MIKPLFSFSVFLLRKYMEEKYPMQKIYAEDMRELLVTELNMNDKWRSIRLSDSEYMVLKSSQVKKIIDCNMFDIIQYSKKHDCDNYAAELSGFVQLVLPGYAFGEAWVHTENGNHAVNIMRTIKGFKLFEPQSSKVYLPEDKDHEVYFVKL